ncbi:MAG: tyrosine-type recombinase/integrase [bacterium]|nr:tyrosine-type recombinase/integrase [bacterium]
MARIRFTQKLLDELTTTKSRDWFYDEQVPLLALMVTAKGAKSFYAIKTKDGVKRHVRIGPYPEVPIPMARRMASDLILKMITGEPVGEELKQRERAAAFSLEDAYNEYCAYLQRHRKPGTIYQYRMQWERFLKDWSGHRALRSIRRREVVDLHQQIGDYHGHHQANRVIALLRAVFNRAIREHEMDIANPAMAITFYRENKRSRRLTPEELPAFFKSVDEEPNRDVRDFVLLSLFTGARKSNMLGMRWKDISMDLGLWQIPSSESKNSKELDVILSSVAMKILRERMELATGEFVFPGRNGRSNEHMREPKFGWLRICKRAGLKDLHLHDLRRSLASFQIDTGTPLEVIQKTLGHESKVTTEIYARLALEPVRASVERATEEMLRRARG